MTLLELLNTTDRFAADSGCQLVEIREGYARAVMTVTEKHLNGGNVCQGGALFTLADIALAAVMNSHGSLTFGIESTITFLKSSRLGDTLTAEAEEIKPHHKIPYTEVKIYNQNKELVCSVTGLAYRKEIAMPYDGLM